MLKLGGYGILNAVQAGDLARVKCLKSNICDLL
jgi:hypothetical protein